MDQAFDVLTPWRLVRAVSTIVLTCLPLVLVLDLLQWVITGFMLVWRSGDWGVQMLIGLVAFGLCIAEHTYPKTMWMGKALVWRFKWQAAQHGREMAILDKNMAYDTASRMEDKLDSFRKKIEEQDCEIANLKRSAKVPLPGLPS